MEYTENEKVLLSKSMTIRCPLCGSANIGYHPVPTQVLSYTDLNKDGTQIESARFGWVNCLHGECQECGFIILRRLDTLYRIGRKYYPDL